MIRVIALLLALAPATTMGAAPVYPFENPTQRERFEALIEQLRCLVCQGESVASSNADLAKDIRQQVWQQIRAGRRDSEIKQYLVDRYGDFILLNPPVKATTWLLWFGPFLLLATAAGFVIRLVRRRQKAPPAPLGDEDRARLLALLKDDRRQ